jgi:ubiquitin-conjugating enzyme E2 D/E
MLAVKRIKKELDKYKASQPKLWTLYAYDNDILTWYVIIHNIGSISHNGKEYKLRIDFPSTYPLYPPTITMLSEINSKYINNRKISIDLIKNKWSPALTIDNLITNICKILIDEDDEMISLSDEDDHVEILVKRFKVM